MLIDQYYCAVCASKDGKRTAELSADPSIVSGAQGVMRIPRDKMGAMTEEGDWKLESYEFQDIEVSIPHPDVAVIAYTVTEQVTMKGEPKSFRAADASTWIRGDDGWTCHAHSETILGDGPA